MVNVSKVGLSNREIREKGVRWPKLVGLLQTKYRYEGIERLTPSLEDTLKEGDMLYFIPESELDKGFEEHIGLKAGRGYKIKEICYGEDSSGSYKWGVVVKVPYLFGIKEKEVVVSFWMRRLYMGSMFGISNSV